MEGNEIAAAIEAVLFAEGDSVKRSDLAGAIAVSAGEIDKAIEALKEKYSADNSGIELIELEDRVQLTTRQKFYDILIKLEAAPKKYRLTDTVLETLSIIAYRQPVTKAEIEAIRGVNSDFAVDKLLGYGFIRELGRKDAPGKPILFGTTEQFLRSFGVKSIEDLPAMPEEKKEEFKTEAEEEVDGKVGV
jgi:segregation and condensation protein B